MRGEGRRGGPSGWKARLLLAGVLSVSDVGWGQQTKAKIDALPVWPVSGRVVNAKDGAPVAGAKVTVTWVQMHCTPFLNVRGQPVPDCAVAPEYTPTFVPVTTDPQGRFFFAAVPEGRISVAAEAKNFFEEWTVVRRPTDPMGGYETAAARDLVIRVLPAASLRGMVVDEEGHPVGDADIALWSAKVYGQGYTMTFYNRSLQTGADGRFAFEGLAPGDYFVSTGAREAMPGGRGEGRVYPSAHWPYSEPGLLSPRTVHLEPGEVGKAAIGLQPALPHRVRGRFVPAPRTQMEAFRTNVMALPEYGGWRYIQTAVREDGTIDMALPDGRYRMAVQTAEERASTTFEVAGGDVSGVRVALRAKAAVPVRIHVPSTGRQPPWPGMSVFERATFGFQVMLGGDADNGEGFGLGTAIVDTAPRPRNDGGTAFHPQMQGEYDVVTTSLPPWYVASVSSGGRDLAAERYKIGDSTDVRPIEIELRDDGGTVVGVARDGGHGVAAFVYALPAFRSTELLRWAMADGEGRYCLTGLAPGAYRMLAMEHEVMIPFREDVSGWMARGQAVTVGAGAAVKVDLSVER